MVVYKVARVIDGKYVSVYTHVLGDLTVTYGIGKIVRPAVGKLFAYFLSSDAREHIAHVARSLPDEKYVVLECRVPLSCCEKLDRRVHLDVPYGSDHDIIGLNIVRVREFWAAPPYDRGYWSTPPGTCGCSVMYVVREVAV